jgi:hypothetical protein
VNKQRPCSTSSANSAINLGAHLYQYWYFCYQTACACGRIAQSRKLRAVVTLCVTMQRRLWTLLWLRMKMRVSANNAETQQQPLPLMISSLEILMVPQPHVSPHTQGCKHNRGKSHGDELLANRLTATFSGQVQSFQGQVFRTYVLNSASVTLPQPQPLPQLQPDAKPRSQLKREWKSVA